MMVSRWWCSETMVKLEEMGRRWCRGGGAVRRSYKSGRKDRLGKKSIRAVLWRGLYNGVVLVTVVTRYCDDEGGDRFAPSGIDWSWVEPGEVGGLAMFSDFSSLFGPVGFDILYKWTRPKFGPIPLHELLPSLSSFIHFVLYFYLTPVSILL
ncbi:hypothetical protein L2E82_40664 [Cichorium intybus]|uniref:Uncharacterized protein n=1 Tax=Cichorium intybus TaxID=13427 RepID=A0ACB9ALF1_CICIN|nr:hypothetical protein L2E82_40664 [Cichorium intybus]